MLVIILVISTLVRNVYNVKYRLMYFIVCIVYSNDIQPAIQSVKFESKLLKSIKEASQ